MSLADDLDYDVSDIFDVVSKPREIRAEQFWHTKDGRKLLVKDMEDSHLFNAYMMSGSNYLFNEMVYRLFEERL
jgi:hypothetical protein